MFVAGWSYRKPNPAICGLWKKIYSWSSSHKVRIGLHPCMTMCVCVCVCEEININVCVWVTGDVCSTKKNCFEQRSVIEKCAHVID